MRSQLICVLVIMSFGAACADSGVGSAENANSGSNGSTANGSTNSSTNAATNSSTNNSTNSQTNNETPGCIPEEEVCDGVDNDCDDEVDEGFADLGEACTVGVGACEETGTIICAASGETTECDAEEGTPAANELCGDSIDNDCDGETDEGFETVGDACTVGMGVCEATGSVVCTANMLDTECDATATQPPESNENTCDALDNDCDGEVDEGCDDDLDGYCDAQFTVTADATCANGGGDCRDDVATAYPDGPPMCDDIDNDCNGTADDIRRVVGSEYTFDLDVAVGSGSTSPILVAPVADGFCVGLTGDDGSAPTRHHAYIDATTGSFTESGSSVNAGDYIADLVSDGTNCYAAFFRDDGDNAWDASLVRWGTSSARTTMNVLTDELLPLAGSWNLALAAVGNELAFSFQPTSGTATQYFTIPTNFTGATARGTSNSSGLTGEFPEFGPNPGTPDLLYFSNFVNINAYEVTLGMNRVSRDQLDISSANRFDEMTVESVNGVMYLALHDTSGDAFELRTITSNTVFGTVGTTPSYSVITSQEYINRQLFAPGPDGLAAMVDPVSDSILLFTAGATTLDFTAVVDTAPGQLLGIRDAGADVLQAIWMTDSGDPNGADRASFEVADYTCY